MKSRLLPALGSLLGLFLFAAALWVLHHELKSHHLHEILQHLKALPERSLILALLLTVFNYLVMTGYDVLGLRYIKHELAYRKIALASFIGYSFSNNIGLSMLAGSSVRYRLYSSWGLSTLEIAQVIGFCTLTLWLGLLSLGGVVFLLEPLAVPRALHLPFDSIRALGVIFLVVVGSYFILTIFRKRSFKIRDWEISLPSLRLFLPQTAIAILDWALAGSVLYVLLPGSPGLSYPGFLGVFLLAQTAGLLSQVPGGLGVFETVVILLLSPALPASQVLGSLLAYRGIYYLLPLLVATILLGIQELSQKKEKLKSTFRLFGKWGSVVIPNALAISTFIGGAILLFSGATPALGSRMDWLQDFLPLPVIEFSHFLGSLVGVGLLLLARGLQRRLDGAYFLTAVLLILGMVISLLKGLDYEEAAILFVMLTALVSCRRYFYRKASLLNQRFSLEWVAAVILVLLGSVWLTFFSYKHVDYSHELWWRFTFSEDAPRSLRALVGAIGLALAFAMTRLLRPATPRPKLAGRESLAKIEPIVQKSARTYANLALLGDKAFMVNSKGDAFIMYSIQGRSWVALGDPVGPREEWPEIAWRFRELCDRYHGWPVFYEISSDNLSLYLDLGLTLLKFGEEARVSLPGFNLEGSENKGLRYSYNRMTKAGCTFEVIPREGIMELLEQFRMISAEWLQQKQTREKKFSLGCFNEDYLKRFPAGIIRKDGKIIAFTNIWLGAEKEEFSIDLMRHFPEAPGGVMDYLFIHLILWGKQEGYRWFNLGMAPLAGIENRALAPFWNRVGAFIFSHGEQFYNFQGLRRYKEKFFPRWEPKYLALPGTLILPRVFADLAALTSGGVKGVVGK
ncbi:MAG: bifunctional lysylphosphatidylglycerol flippase/synthetase MprF [bacterium]|nr:bifunctional lysylphosphatidylglycerol flippase/synthetase MprF [bacterium]